MRFVVTGLLGRLWLWAYRPVVRWQCVRRLRALGLPSRFSVDRLCERITRELGREIYFATVALPPEAPSGLVLLPRGYVIIVVDSRTPAWHRWHILLHELCHLAWGHVGRPLSDPTPALRQLFPTMLHHVLARTSCSPSPTRISREEAQTEMLASITMGRITSWQPSHTGPMPAEVDDTLRRLEATLE